MVEDLLRAATALFPVAFYNVLSRTATYIQVDGKPVRVAEPRSAILYIVDGLVRERTAGGRPGGGEERRKACLQSDVEKLVVSWWMGMEGSKRSTDLRFSRTILELVDAGLLCQGIAMADKSLATNDRRKKTLRLTDFGQRCLDVLRSHRHRQIARLIDVSVSASICEASDATSCPSILIPPWSSLVHLDQRSVS